jgi:U3 small nucleolar RNA-associated protein 21
VHVWNLGTKDTGDDDGDGDGDDSDMDLDVDLETREGGRRKGPTIVNRKLQFSIDNAHLAECSRVHFLHGEPIMVSASHDNSIKVWIYDTPDGTARLLKSREGHYGHPNKVRYYGGVTQASMHDNASAESCEMLSAGSDGTLRHFNTALEQQNREMSSKVILDKLGMRRRNERLPQCLDFAFCETRQRDWGDLVTVHRNHSNAYVWRYKSRTITDMILRQPNWHNNDKMYSPDRRLFATTVGMSPCGNFAFVGHRSGDVFIYNLQSGLGRGSLPKSAADPYAVVKKGTIASRKATPANVLHSKDQVIQPTWTPMNPKGGGKREGGDMNVTQGGEGWGNVGDNNNNSSDIDSEMRHTKEVRGIFVDLVQGVVVTCGLDGKVIFWDYHSHEALSHLQLDSPQTKLEGCRDAGFVAVVGLDRVVRVLDLSTQRLTRRFEGHSREVSDLAFTPDGRRLLTASTDCTVRVWDMPTGRCLAWLGFDAPIRSIAMSLSGEYLCVAQSGKEGVYMYLDRSLYESVQFWKEPTEPTAVRDAHVTLTDSADTAGTAYSTDPDKSSSSMGDDDGALAAGTEERGEIRAPQGQVVGSTVRESTEQRGLGSLTLSLLPRAYWITLFNLELIKSRNKPKAPPTPKEAAPFFLPTVRKGGGVAASFPTPDEYAKIRSELSAATSGSGSGGGAKRAAASGEEDGDNDEHSEATASASTNKKSRKSKGGDTSSTSMEEEERVMAELAAMGGAWDDDGADDDEWASPPQAVKEPATDQTPAAATSISSSSSRILSKAGKGKGGRKGQSPRTAMPRCKMTAFLLAETAEPSLVTAQNTSNNGTGNNNNNGEEEEDDGPVVPKSKLLDYLKTLPPPAVDLELRALCNGADDEEGVALVARLLAWFVGRLRSGTDFEVLEAYLHRTLVIYADQMVSGGGGGGGGGGSHYPPNGDIGGYSYPPGDAAATTSNLLLPLAQRVAKAHKAGLARLRTLIQGNLCLLKLLAKMPPM